MTSGFLLKFGHLGYYVMSRLILLDPLFYLASSDTNSKGEVEGVPPYYCQVGLEGQVPYLAFIDI